MTHGSLDVQRLQGRSASSTRKPKRDKKLMHNAWGQSKAKASHRSVTGNKPPYNWFSLGPPAGCVKHLATSTSVEKASKNIQALTNFGLPCKEQPAKNHDKAGRLAYASAAHLLYSPKTMPPPLRAKTK